LAEKLTHSSASSDISIGRRPAEREDRHEPFFFLWIKWVTPFRAGTIHFVLALAVSLFTTQVLRPLFNIDRPLGGEGYDGYLELGQNLAAGNGYIFERGGHKVFHRPPLYPALLVPGMFLPSDLHRTYVAVLNAALLGCASALLFTGTKALFGFRVAAVAWLIFCLNPFVLVGAKNAVPASLQIFGYMAVLYVTLRAYLKITTGERFTFSEIVTYAAACWFATMSHGTMLAASILLILANGCAALWRKQWWATRALAITVVLLAIGIAPWTLRNYRVTGLFIPVVGNSGLAYFAGNAHWGITHAGQQPEETRHEAEFRHMGLPREFAAKHVRYYGMNDPKIEQHANERMKEHMRAYPGDFLRKVTLNAVEYYFPIFYYFSPPKGIDVSALPLAQRIRAGAANTLPQSVFHAVLVTVAFAGLIQLLRSREHWKGVVLAVAWALFALPYFPFLTYFLGRSHYTFGTYPVLAILAAVILVQPFSRRSHD
jgi:hypothetical protein